MKIVSAILIHSAEHNLTLSLAHCLTETSYDK